jgi:hypothetical protein
LQQGNDPKKGYARTWASQTGSVAAGIACDSVVISAKDNSESPLRIFGPGSNLADHRLLEITSGGELILAGGTGNGDRRMQQRCACRAQDSIQHADVLSRIFSLAVSVAM